MKKQITQGPIKKKMLYLCFDTSILLSDAAQFFLYYIDLSWYEY